MFRFCLILLMFTCDTCSKKVKSKLGIHDRLKEKAVLALVYCRKNKMNVDFCVLIDMKIPSGKKRFFLWDFKGDSVLNSGMCSHGTCGNLKGYDSGNQPQFSNVPESYCSSLGKYRIGKRGYSTFGININYKLHGLEKTNDNAYKRYVVFHSWDISDEEIYPLEISESWGCPAVSNNFMREMDEVLKKQEKPVLLWIYY